MKKLPRPPEASPPCPWGKAGLPFGISVEPSATPLSNLHLR